MAPWPATLTYGRTSLGQVPLGALPFAAAFFECFAGPRARVLACIIFERRNFDMPARHPTSSALCPRLLSLIALALVTLLGASCSGSERTLEHAPRPRFIKAPPKPGQSINTQMCECDTCSPRECCAGADETQVSDPSCNTDFDFTKNDACGISVRSCTTRCAKEIWRVKRNETCDSKRPASCCGSAS